MKRETIWKTSITTTLEAEDAVAELITELVAPHPSAYTDAESGVTIVSAFTTTPPKNTAATRRALRAGLLAITRCGLNIGVGKITIQKLPRKNWAESWKRHFRPITIGARLLVKPSWIRRQPKRGQAVIVLDPGLSFGTGQHPTTEFCLRQLVRGRGLALRCPRPRPAGGTKLALALDTGRPLPRRYSAGSPPRGNPTLSCLDIGTGSGILAIAAAKLGYAPVHALDFDPQCIRVAKANAATNRVEKKIRITCADLTKLPLRSAKQYDLVCANLLANLLIAERDRILARVKPDGVLVVAGILKREFAEVQTAYEAVGWRLAGSKAEKEWRSGAFSRVRRPRRT